MPRQKRTCIFAYSFSSSECRCRPNGNHTYTQNVAIALVIVNVVVVSVVCRHTWLIRSSLAKRRKPKTNIYLNFFPEQLADYTFSKCWKTIWHAVYRLCRLSTCEKGIRWHAFCTYRSTFWQNCTHTYTNTKRCERFWLGQHTKLHISA